MTITIKQDNKDISYRCMELSKDGFYIVGLYKYGKTIKQNIYHDKKSALNYYYSLKKDM